MAFLEGTVVSVGPGELVLQVGPVGIQCLVPVRDVAQVRPGARVRLHTHLQVREEDVVLYGFLEGEELRLFRLLLSVSGVGPKLALALLSALSPAELTAAIVAQDVSRLARAEGVGKKTAARVVLELRERLGGGTVPAAVERSSLEGPLQEASAALMALGLSEEEVRRGLGPWLEEPPRDVPVEEMVRVALRRLQG